MDNHYDRLHKLLALTGSANDGEALTALRRAQDLLQHEGVRLEDFAHQSVINAAISRGSLGDQPGCQSVRINSQTSLEVRPAARAALFPISDKLHDDAAEIAQRLGLLLSAASDNKAQLQLRIEVQGAIGRILGEVGGFKPLEIWTGDKDSATALLQILRRAAAHALRLG